jgi:archaeal flagellar protein FlaJ
LALSSFQRSSYRMFGPVAGQRLKLDKLRQDISRARLPIRAEAYAAYALTAAAITFVGVLIFTGFVGLVLLPQVGVAPSHPAVILALLATPVLFALAMYGILLTSPASKAKARGKNLDAYLPYALNYIAAMASAGVPVYSIFHSLAAQPIYGEISAEARWITKDVFLGTDTVTAMRRAADRSPSPRWAEVLQGAITTVTSGGDLKAYFAQKADRYAWENRTVQKQFVEVMGLMAETYVTAASSP